MDKTAKHMYEFGPFRLIPREQQLLRDNQLVPLTPKSFDLLVVLIENSGHLVKKEELMERIWPDSFVEEANLSVKMSELRRALGEGPNDKQYIETVPRRGYRFVAEVKDNSNAEIADHEISAGKGLSDPRIALSDDETKAHARQTHSKFVYRFLIPVLALVLVFAAAVGLNTFGLRDRLFGTGGPESIQSVAVLPLENLSGDASQEYFADGMTEALINDLGKISSLRVISRASVQQYKGSRKTLAEIGRELNVDAVLTGSVIRSGDRVKISLQLSYAPEDRTLWTDSYDGNLRDVLTLQGQVARDVAGKIRIKLTPQEQVEFGMAGPVNPDAYDHYLRGKFYLHKHTKENNANAITELENAVAIDPGFAAGHGELAQAYVWKLFLYSPEEMRLAESAYVEAEKALSLDPNLAVAYLARGRLLWTPANNFPHQQAIRQYRRALELDPNLDEARNQLALVYNHIGALDEALKELQRAVATNPSNTQAQFRIGETLLFQGKFEEAISILRGVPSDANPALVGHLMAWALRDLGRKEEASATLNQYLAKYPEDNRGLFTSMQSVTAAADGHNEEAERKIQQALEKGRGFGHFHHTAYQIACAYALMKKPEQAVKWLEIAADTGFPCFPLFEKDPNLDNLPQDPRFRALVERLRQQLAQYRSEW